MIEGPIQTNNSGLVFYFDTREPKSYIGEPTTNIWSVQIGTSVNGYNSWDMPNAGTASISSAIATAYGTWNGNTIWLVTVGSGTLVSYGSWRKCVDQPTAGSTYPSTRRVAAKIRMLTGSITNIGLHSGGGTGGYNASDFTSISEKNVPSDCIIKDGWVQMLSDASWSSTTVGHCVGIGLNNSGPYSFLVTEPMYYPNNRLVNFTPTSRSNTQGLRDLTGGSTIDLTNAGYNVSSEITFNGSSNYIITPTINLGNTFTITAWFNSSGVAGDTVIVGTDANGCDNWLGVSGGYLYGFVTQIADVNNFTFIGATALSNNQWYHASIVVNVNTVTLYLNGKQDYTTTTAFTIGAWNGTFSIGRRCPSVAQRFFNGKIDTVSMYNRVLSAAEIFKNFNSQKSRYSV
jgi:hypothetical protein